MRLVGPVEGKHGNAGCRSPMCATEELLRGDRLLLFQLSQGDTAAFKKKKEKKMLFLVCGSELHLAGHKPCFVILLTQLNVYKQL